LALALAAGACAGGPGTLPPLTTGALVPGAAVPAGRIAAPVPEVYTRIARPALACWFGPGGALKPTHVFQADLEPADRGGRSEVAIHERQTGGETLIGRRVLRIALEPSDTSTELTIENFRLPDPLFQRLRADLARWIEGATDCNPADIVAAAPPPPPARKKAVRAAVAKTR
jgi:hypothetical protein